MPSVSCKDPNTLYGFPPTPEFVDSSSLHVPFFSGIIKNPWAQGYQKLWVLQLLALNPNYYEI